MPKGQKFGGRQKGTINKDRRGPAEKAIELGIDPFEVLLRFAAEDWKGLGYKARTTISYTNAGIEFEEFVIKPELRGHCAKEACKYIHAQRKAIETTIDAALAEQMKQWEKMPTEDLRAIFNKMMEGNSLKPNKE